MNRLLLIALMSRPGRKALAWTLAALLAMVLVPALIVAGTLSTFITATASPCGTPSLPASSMGGGGSVPADALSEVHPGKPDDAAQAAANAVTIMDVGRTHHIPPRGWVIALATALQESTLLNLPDGDRDSAGLFQQRPSTGWGSHAQVTNPNLAAQAFYGVALHTTNPGLLSVPSWEQQPLTDVAQQVQKSAYPDAYARWEPLAQTLVQHYLTSSVTTAPTTAHTPPSSTIDTPEVSTRTTSPTQPSSMSAGASEPHLDFPADSTPTRTASPPGVPSTGSSPVAPTQTSTSTATPAPSTTSTSRSTAPPTGTKSGGSSGAATASISAVTGSTSTVGTAGWRLTQNGQPCPTTSSTVSLSLTGATAGERAVQAALKQLGVKYAYGGGGPQGPSSNDAGGFGFDCSSLMQFAWWNANHTELPRTTYEIARNLPTVPLDQLRPGDMVITHHADHVVMVAGDGQLIHAPRTGDVVKLIPGLTPEGKLNEYWSAQAVSAHRPG